MWDEKRKITRYRSYVEAGGIEINVLAGEGWRDRGKSSVFDLHLSLASLCKNKTKCWKHITLYYSVFTKTCIFFKSPFSYILRKCDLEPRFYMIFVIRHRRLRREAVKFL